MDMCKHTSEDEVTPNKIDQVLIDKLQHSYRLINVLSNNLHAAEPLRR
jgi:hypothetical protein